MKTLWFNLMPYPHLPADFRDKHSSVWVDIPQDLFDTERATAMYNDYIDEFEVAARAGFDAVCVNEHHSNGYGMMPSPNLIASILARTTRDTAICILGNSIALYNPPTRVAEELAMLDCISGGRVIAGFPVGTPMDACFAYSQNPSTLREKYLEAHDLIMRTWRESKPFAHNGRFNQLRYVNPWPQPVQRPHPPVWIPGGASIDTWRFCAERDYVYCHLSYYGIEAAREGMRGFWSEVEKAGKDRNPYRAGFLQFVGVAETRAEAMRLYKEPAEYFYGRCLHVDPRYGGPAGYVSEDTVRAGIVSQVGAAAAKSRMNMAFDKKAREMEAIVQNGYVVVGSPDEVAAQLRSIATELSIGHLLLLLHFGNMSKDVTNYNTTLFAEKVLPQLQDLFVDWEDHWWPTGARAPRAGRTA
jgi:alkanesulfonate monooxygenase SsuD/methylene tetrahydromethanopterin reductase-like flavin-dependent oxidoreductase (luciferase family)